MIQDTPHILLINPWIHDFAAYDFWAKPLGLLMLAAILRHHEFRISYVDCLDRFHPKGPVTDPLARNGRGPYLKTRIPKPRGLADIPRNYSRYGIRPQWFRGDVRVLPKPDLILTTALMTYWYPGLVETITEIKHIFPAVPVVLGGIYASLCYDHAVRFSGADHVVTGPGEEALLHLVGRFTGYHAAPRLDLANMNAHPYPAFDLQRKIPYVPLLTIKGCPFSCDYCAAHYLNPELQRRRPASVVEEIRYWHGKHGVTDFIFYDDALLADAPSHALPLLEKIVAADLKIRFHTPNALHIRNISRDVAQLMFRAGFKTLRLGLEMIDFEKKNRLDTKVTRQEFTRAVSLLKNAGFNSDQIGAYLLVGLPGQSLSDARKAIMTVRNTGITPVPAYYTPIPHTALWTRAVRSSRYDLASDPVFANNAVLPCSKTPFSWETISALKTDTRGDRAAFTP